MMHLLSHQHTLAFIFIQIGQRNFYIEVMNLMHTNWPLWCCGAVLAVAGSMKSKRLLLCNVNKGTMVFQPISCGFPCFSLSFLFIFQMTLKPLSFPFTLTLTLSLSHNQTGWPPYNPFAL